MAFRVQPFECTLWEDDRKTRFGFSTSTGTLPHDYGDRTYFDCPRCDLFGLPTSAEHALPELLTTPRRASVLS
jgi:hypothetical protein